MTQGSADNSGSGETMLEVFIGYLLIAGVITSVVLESIGIILFYGTYGNTQVSQNQAFFIKGNDFFSFIVQQTQHLFGSQNALLFMTLGFIALLLTPYMRAITSVIYFGWEKNAKFVVITVFVLLVLTLSLVLH
jgi:uncharacterized membrane protein